MANIKSFKEVLEIAITEDTVKVVTILDRELSIHAKQTLIYMVNDLKSNRIDNGQMEIEFSEYPSRPGLHGKPFTINLDENWYGNASYNLGEDAKFCACI